MGELRVIGGLNLHELVPEGEVSAVEKAARKGDMPYKWNPDNPKEVDYAEKIWRHSVTKKGFKAFKVGRRGQRGEQITQFDPGLGEVIIVPPMAGG